jgi:Zn-dependent protease
MSHYFFLGVQFIITLFSLWVHEKAHVWMAVRCGDLEAAKRGQIAGNPFASVDWIGTALLPLFLLWRGQPVLGWTKPLTLDPENLRRPFRDGLLIAASGPAANLLLALVGGGIFLSLKTAGLLTLPLVANTLFPFCLINVMLGIFNLLPIPPLDGSAMAELFLRGDALSAFEDIKPYGFILLLAGAFLNFFDFISLPVSNLLMAVLGF